MLIYRLKGASQNRPSSLPISSLLSSLHNTVLLNKPPSAQHLQWPSLLPTRPLLPNLYSLRDPFSLLQTLSNMSNLSSLASSLLTRLLLHHTLNLSNLPSIFSLLHISAYTKSPAYTTSPAYPTCPTSASSLPTQRLHNLHNLNLASSQPSNGGGYRVFTRRWRRWRWRPAAGVRSVGLRWI